MPTRPPVKKPLFITRIKGKNKLSKKTLDKLDTNKLNEIKKFQDSGKLDKLNNLKNQAFISGLHTEFTGSASLGLAREFHKIKKEWIAEKDLNKKAKLLTSLKNVVNQMEKINSKYFLANENFDEIRKKRDTLEKERDLIESDAVKKHRRLQAYNFRKGIYKKK